MNVDFDREDVHAYWSFRSFPSQKEIDILGTEYCAHSALLHLRSKLNYCYSYEHYPIFHCPRSDLCSETIAKSSDLNHSAAMCCNYKTYYFNFFFKISLKKLGKNCWLNLEKCRLFNSIFSLKFQKSINTLLPEIHSLYLTPY